MGIELIPAAFVAQELTQKIILATHDLENEWFFYDGAFNSSVNIESSINTWANENHVAVYNKEIMFYFEGQWTRPLDIISAFRTINFSKRHSQLFIRALLKYLEYLFIHRGCKAFNWTVAIQNESAKRQYDKIVTEYCGRVVGIRHYSQKSYTGKISDSCLYEVTKEDFFELKNRGFAKRPQLS